jgi:hypothetical protein
MHSSQIAHGDSGNTSAMKSKESVSNGNLQQNERLPISHATERLTISGSLESVLEC